jgi:hypothetical protein
VPLTATDIAFCASQNMTENDTGVTGGSVDPTRRVDFTQLTVSDSLEAFSSSGSDLQNCTIEARIPTGQIVSQVLPLTGTTAVPFTGIGTAERVLSVDLASVANGTVTVRARTSPNMVVRTIGPGERGFLAPFRRASSDPLAIRDYYAKVFVRNTHPLLALLDTSIVESADPDDRITFAVAATINDAATSANRLTAPSVGDLADPDVFDNGAKTVPGGPLAPGSAIGVWLRMRLPANDDPHRAPFALQVTGGTY